MFTSRRITTMGGDKFRDEFSLAFDGTNDHIDCGDVLDQGTGNFSISVWFKLNSGTSQYDCLIAKRTSTGSGSLGWQMDIRGTDPWKIGFAYDDGPTTKTILGSTSIPEDTWNHYVAVIDKTGANKIFAYLNGVEDDTVGGISPLGTISNDAPLSIGCKKVEDDSLHSNFVGKISEIAFYDTALTASQVKTLYNGREPYNHKEGIASGNLLAWWRMGDGTLDKATLDMAGSGDTGLICDEVNPTLGAELVSNGDFDDETNYSDYNMEGDDTADLSTEQVLVGSNSLKIDVDSSGEGTRLGGVATTAGKTYKISAWFYVTAGTAKINPGDSYWSPNGLEPKTKVTNKWQQLVMYNTADENSSNAWIYFVAGSNNSVFYLDNVSVREVQGNPGIFLNSDNQFSGDTP